MARLQPRLASLPRLMRRFAPLLTLLALAPVAAGCGSSTKPADIPSGTPASSASDTTAADTTTTATTTSSTNKGSTPRVSKTTDLSKKPVIPKQPANPPTKLVV